MRAARPPRVDESAPDHDPFGDPDGARADLDELDRQFVAMGGLGGIATRQDDLSARVIVGRKGAGKTVYLRRSRAYAAGQDELFADDLQQSLPTTSDIVKVANWYPASELAEKWMLLWRAAILRSVVSHLLCNRRLLLPYTEVEERELREDFKPVLGGAHDCRAPLSVYSQLIEIINSHQTRNGIERYLKHRRWAELEYRVADRLNSLPPMCFYIDAIDEEFRHAPMYWLMCQKGLFYQVFRLLRDSRLGGRLHIFICVRDHVYSSVLRTEHAMRYVERRRIRLLDWDEPSIRYLLARKLERLDSVFFMRPQDGTGLDAWLGIENVQNEARKRPERVDDYILRHTRLLPRDVVVLGNEFCNQIYEHRRTGRRRLDDATIRQVVHRSARLWGAEQIAICANQITSDLMHDGAALQGISELYTNSSSSFTGADAYQESVSDRLRAFLERIGQDRFDRRRFNRFDKAIRETFDGLTDPMSVLWQNGLLGHRSEQMDECDALFYSAADGSTLTVPRDADEYVLHPCLLDAARISSGGPGSAPVRPRRSHG